MSFALTVLTVIWSDIVVLSYLRVNPYPAKVISLNFQPLEVVFRYRDPQPQVAENYSWLKIKRIVNDYFQNVMISRHKAICTSSRDDYHDYRIEIGANLKGLVYPK